MRILRQTFSSLAVRNYRLLFFGMLISSAGTWMQSVALGWLVLDLTGSGTAVGLITAAQFLPMLFLGAWGGLIADRFDKRRILVMTQTAMGLSAGFLATVVLLDVVELWMVFASALALGFATVIDNPARQSFISELVGPERVTNAIALNSAMFNASRMVGPAIAGVLILRWGTGICFAINAFSYIAVIIGVLMMRASELQRGRPVARARGQVRAGLRYVWSTPDLRSTILLVAVVGTFTLNFQVILPVLARFTFDRGPGTLGLLYSVMGAGSLVGALVAAGRNRPSRNVMIGGAFVLGVLMLGVAVAPNLAVATVLLALTGAATITFLSTANALLQLSSDQQMRGRVMALYAMVFLGSTPIGGPIVGWIGEQWSPRASFAVAGLAALVGAAMASTISVRAGRRSTGTVDDAVPSEVATV